MRGVGRRPTHRDGVRSGLVGRSWCNDGLTGKTMGMPPLTGLLPSRTAFSLSQRFSRLCDFQEMTVAPWRRTSTDSPVASFAITFELSEEMSTVACSLDGEGAMADGLCPLSTILRGGLGGSRRIRGEIELVRAADIRASSTTFFRDGEYCKWSTSASSGH